MSSDSNKRQKTVSVSPTKQPSNPFKAIETSIHKLDSMTAAKNVEQKIQNLMLALFKKKEELREEQKELAWERGKKSGLDYRGPNAISCECGNRVNPDGEYVGIVVDVVQMTMRKIQMHISWTHMVYYNVLTV